jgi:gliding motility-associated-like protein
LSDKDEIKELFQRELGNYEAKVDPSIWSGIQSGLSSSTAAASGSLGIAAKITIAIATSAILGTAAYYILSDKVVPAERELAEEMEKVANEKADKIVETENKSIQKVDVSTQKERRTPLTDSSLNVDLKAEHDNNLEASNNDSLVSPQVKVNEQSTSQTGIDPTKNNGGENKTTEATPEKNIDTSESLKTNSAKERSLLELKPFIERQENQRIKFGIEQKNITDIYWDFGDGNRSRNFSPEHFYDKSGEYIVTVSGMNGDEEIQKMLRVKVEVEGKILNLPNVFTPNRDGQNDYFFIESEGLVDFQITIMNTKQEVVFQSNNSSFKWNGLLQNGKVAPSGNYVYIVIASDKAGNTINKYQRLSISRD